MTLSPSEAAKDWNVYRVTCKISTDRTVDRVIAATSAQNAADSLALQGSDVRVVTDLGSLEGFNGRDFFGLRKAARES